MKSKTDRSKLTDEYIHFLSVNVYSGPKWSQYVKDCGGVGKLRKRDLDKIMNIVYEESGYTAFRDPGFMEIYKIVSDNATNKVINRWAIVAGISGAICAISAAISILTAFVGNGS